MKPTESRKRYNDYPAYFKELFGERVQKLSIDGGFTCQIGRASCRERV